MIVISEILIPV